MPVFGGFCDLKSEAKALKYLERGHSLSKVDI